MREAERELPGPSSTIMYAARRSRRVLIRQHGDGSGDNEPGHRTTDDHVPPVDGFVVDDLDGARDRDHSGEDVHVDLFLLR